MKDGSRVPAPEVFPYLYQVQLSFQPQAPIPTAFQVNITFTDSAAKNCKGILASIALDFEDLFLPLWVPPTKKMVLIKFIIFFVLIS
jgi:hypothetical protein